MLVMPGKDLFVVCVNKFLLRNKWEVHILIATLMINLFVCMKGIIIYY